MSKEDELRMKEEREKERKERETMEWGSGLVQKREQEKMIDETLIQGFVGLSRYQDDAQLNEYKRNEYRAEDPLNDMPKEKQESKNKKKKHKKKRKKKKNKDKDKDRKKSKKEKKKEKKKKHKDKKSKSDSNSNSNSNSNGNDRKHETSESDSDNDSSNESESDMDVNESVNGNDIIERPMYKGKSWANRYNILSGYRWDGVDRSNGFEIKKLKRIGELKDAATKRYKWSVADM